MALSMSQTYALFEGLEVPYATENNILSSDGLVAINQQITNQTRQAQTLIENWLTNKIYPTPTAETDLKVLLDRWIALGSSTVNIQGGSVGNIQGVTSDPAQERVLLQKKIIIRVPFYRCHEDFMRNQSCSINLRRA